MPPLAVYPSITALADDTVPVGAAPPIQLMFPGISILRSDDTCMSLHSSSPNGHDGESYPQRDACHSGVLLPRGDKG